MIHTGKKHETAVLVGVRLCGQEDWQITEYLDELEFLADTAGASVKKRFTQKLDHPDSATFVGSGKLREIHKYVGDHEVDIVIFDDELSGSQIRNLEKGLSFGDV